MRSNLFTVAMIALLAPQTSTAQRRLITMDTTEPAAAAEGLRTCALIFQGEPDDTDFLSVGFGDIFVNDPQGFFQVPVGGDGAPPELFLDFFPELSYDSFVTIALTVVPDGMLDCTSFDAAFDSASFNNGTTLRSSGGWFCNNPPSPQNDLDPETGQLQIAQFTVREGFSVFGEMQVFLNEAPDVAEVDFVCFDTCPADINDSGTVNAQDLALFLGADIEAGDEGAFGNPADVNGDGVLNAIDLALVLGHWGPCPFNSCGVPGSGSCDDPNNLPGCSDAACCATVCAEHPLCCNLGWDLDCVGFANELCQP